MYLEPTLAVAAVVIAGLQGEVTRVGGLLKQNQLGVERALAQADVHSHSFQGPECVHVVLHGMQPVRMAQHIITYWSVDPGWPL